MDLFLQNYLVVVKLVEEIDLGLAEELVVPVLGLQQELVFRRVQVSFPFVELILIEVVVVVMEMLEPERLDLLPKDLVFVEQAWHLDSSLELAFHPDLESFPWLLVHLGWSDFATMLVELFPEIVCCKTAEE